ncbi:MAG TPA: TolC family outer membrane protein [Ideonella sp.]|nr:TolC family outer membrane protein [Ideonella sp.]
MPLPRRFKLHRAALLVPLALAFGAAGSARAQSLLELYNAARAYDAVYLATRSQADAAQFRADQARALKLPSVGLAGTANLGYSDTPDSDSALTARTKSAQLAINGQQTLFNKADSATISQAERGVTIAQAQLRGAEQDLIVRLSQAYFDVLAASDTLGTVLASKKAISEQLASAKRNFEVGTATITDTREAQARYDLALAQEIAADNDLRVKQLALEQTVGRTGISPRPLAVPVELPLLVPAAVDDWVINADNQSPAVQQARLALEVAKLETDKARAGHLPTVTLTASVGTGRNLASGDAATGLAPPLPQTTAYNLNNSGTTAGIGLTVNVPLFAGYSIQNRVKETLSLEEKSVSDLDFARRTVAQGTRQAFFGVQSGHAQVKALEAAESSSKLALEATQLGYRVGVRVNIDVLNAQTQLFQTQRDLSKARYDVVMGGLRLRQASGLLVPDDVQAVNTLLAR